MPPTRSVYLDHSASTPVDPRVLDVMLPYFSEIYGNASSVHGAGRRAEQAIEDARETVAAVLNCRPSEIVFTGGGSESDNLALRGVAWAARKRDARDHLITTPVEHSAVSNTVAQLANEMSFQRTVLPVDRQARVTVADLTAALTPATSVVSIVYANNEVGTVQPIAQLAAAAHEAGALFHTDAVQAGGQLSLDVQALGVDLMSLSAHKFYGPKGAGVLFVRDGVELMTSQTGGSHEAGRRAGTHNTPAIVGLAAALKLAYDEREARVAHFTAMRDRLIDGVLASVPGAALTGATGDERLPSHASFVFDGVDGNALLMHLDMKGIAASSGSACKVGNPEPSSVLLAMGYDATSARGSLRLTVGLHTTADDIDYAVDAVAESVRKLARLGVA